MRLSAPQNIFLNQLNTKFRAYVGGFGCVHPDTRVWTERGLMRIADLTAPVRVLSWNEKMGQFQLSLSGGAFPKGRANLYRVTTQQGEFVASGHHRTLSADGKYQRVDSLSVGDELSSFGKAQHLTTEELARLSSLSGAQHYSEIAEGLMGRYANEARQYGLQLLNQEDRGQSFEPSQVDAQQYGHYSCRECRMALGLSHSHQDQLCDRQTKSDFLHLFEPRHSGAVGQKLSLSFEHTSHAHLEGVLFGEMSESHCKGSQLPSVDHSFRSSLSESTTILSIEVEPKQEEYWDLQVLDTNNYVTEDGCIHHNSGKTFVGCLDLLIFFAKHPGTRQGYFGPSYPSIRDIFFPTFEEAANIMGFTCEIRESNKEVHLYRNGRYYGTVICRSMDRPSSIIGFKISRALVDEIDTLPKNKAQTAWNKIIARLRLSIPGVENSIGVTTTPEGFMFVYEQFALNPTERYSMVQASTYENQDNLPEDYIDSLIETYPAGLIQAYLEGEFVNLTSGTVYRNYDRMACESKESIIDGEPLAIGMDFNVGKMAACVFVRRDDGYHCVEEITSGLDTEYVSRIIKERWQDKGHKITVYPDASGKNTSSKGASLSDIAILESYKFSIRANNANPRVRDRINSVNKCFEDGRLWVNSMRCPETSRCLEQQPYDDNGEPDKKSGLDHQVDAFGYFCAYEFPVRKPIAHIPVTFAR